jgi:hypothetical protein
MMRDRTIQQQSGEHERCAQQDRFLAQIVDQSLKGRGTHSVTCIMQKLAPQGSDAYHPQL